MRTRLARPALLSWLFIAVIASATTAQPADPAPASKKDKETPKKPELPKAPPPKPASEITLKVGDKAPLFKPDTWVKPIPAPAAALPASAPSSSTTPAAPAASPSPGFTPDTLTFDPSKVYVIEFWATWCSSCRDAMPSLAKLARDNKDLVIVAVASSERKPPKDGPDQRLEGVRKFVETHPEYFSYGVVFDGTRTIASNWIAAAGRVYIPTSFVVDNTGVIAWIGDPREKAFDTAITKALKALPQPKPPEPVTPDPKKKPAKPRPKG